MFAKKFIYTVIISSSLLVYGVAMADDVPVVNAYQYESADNSNNNSSDTATANPTDNQDQSYLQAPQPHLSTSQRLSRLEAQMQNQQSMNLPGQIQQLQQQVEKLQGELQVQDHELQQLSTKNISSNTKKIQLPDTSINATTATTTAQSASTSTTATTTNTAAVTASPATQSSGSNFLNDQSTYQAAYNLIAASKYPEAKTAFNNYLQKYPNGRYAANAYYWLGELDLLQNNDAAAQKDFETVIAKYPTSTKIQDATLKIGLIYYDNGQFNKAKTQLQKVVKLYPGTPEARLASARLIDINQKIKTQQSANNTQPAAVTQPSNTAAASVATPAQITNTNNNQAAAASTPTTATPTQN